MAMLNYLLLNFINKVIYSLLSLDPQSLFLWPVFTAGHRKLLSENLLVNISVMDLDKFFTCATYNPSSMAALSSGNSGSQVQINKILVIATLKIALWIMNVEGSVLGAEQ